MLACNALHAKKGGLLRILLGLLTLLLSYTSFAAVFKSDRFFPQTPAHCQKVKPSHFKEAPLTFIYGSEGATRRGFDLEFPIARANARTAWHILKDGKVTRRERARAQEKSLRLLKYVDLLHSEGPKMEFNFSSEGEILEVLVISNIQKQPREFFHFLEQASGRRFHPQDFYVFGSVGYSRLGDRRLGELDLIIARKSNCEVVAIGEVKLGHRGLGKARRQMQRFINFYNREIK